MGITDLPYRLPKSLDHRAEHEAAVKAWRSQGRYAKNADNKVMVNAKVYALHILDALTNYIVSMRLHTFLFDFRQVCVIYKSINQLFI